MKIIADLDDPVDDLQTEYGTDCRLWLSSSATETGTYADVTSTLLTVGQQQYELVDTAWVTGNWYKWRIENAPRSLFTEYSDPWLSESLTGYCSIDDVDETLSLGTSQTRFNLISDMIVSTSAAIDSACGRQFYRSPQVTGDETFYFDVIRPGLSSLALATGGAGCSDGKALDIVSVTSLHVRSGETGSYTEITAGDSGYYLMAGTGPGAAGTDWPYEDVSLSRAGSYSTWPTGLRAVKVIGVRGFPKVPGTVNRAAISEVRNRFRAGIAAGAGQSDGQPAPGDETDWLRVMFEPYRKKSYAAI